MLFRSPGASAAIPRRSQPLVPDKPVCTPGGLAEGDFLQEALERSFYERYFRNATWYRDVARIEAVAQAEATKAGLGAMDALHLAAAHLSRADEFITTEKPPKAIHRSMIVKVVYLFD